MVKIDLLVVEVLVVQYLEIMVIHGKDMVVLQEHHIQVDLDQVLQMVAGEADMLIMVNQNQMVVPVVLV